ncbi:MAG: hypothetical protein ACK58L_06085 [Planctomycetota bacterium]
MSSQSWLSSLVVWTAAFASFAGLTTPATMAVADTSGEFHTLPDGEVDFVKRLIELQMFEVAAQYCERSSELRNDIDQQSDWECLIAMCRLRQAWTLEADSRLDTIRMAVQRLSDFSAEHIPSLRQHIQLRLAQLELLGVAGQIQEQLRLPISAKPPSIAFVRDSSDEFSLKAAEQGCMDLESLLQQLEASRKDLDAAYVRVVRDQARTLMAQMLLTRFHLNSDSESARQLDQAIKLAEPVSKNAGDPAARFRARAILVELNIAASESAPVDLQLKSLQELADSAPERTRLESLRVRSLLHHGRPSDALEQSIRSDDLLFESSAELKVLRLQCLLQIFELLSALPDAGRSPAMKAETANEFTMLRNRIAPRLDGVWRERFDRIALRFHRVDKVGPELADALDHVDILRSRNQSEAAAGLLQKVASQLPPDQQQLRASILLELGQLLLKQKSWSPAEAALQESSMLFLSEGQRADAAAADLLRIFSIGKQWELSPEARVPALIVQEKNENPPEQRYRSALDLHLQSFASESTFRKALEWRAILNLDSNALAAAADLLQATETIAVAEPSKDQRLLLALACEALLDVRLRSRLLSSDETSQLKSLLSTLKQHSLVNTPVKPNAEESEMILNGMQLALAISEPRGDADFWDTEASEARRILEFLSHSEDPEKSAVAAQNSALPVSDISPLRLRNVCRSLCHAVLIAACFRRLEDASQIEPSRSVIVTSSRRERNRCVALLTCQLSDSGSSLPGDPQLAKFLAQLVTEPHPDSLDQTTSAMIDQLIILRQLCRHSNDWQPYVERLKRLMQGNLNDGEILQISDLLSPEESQNITDDSVVETELSFWRVVQKRVRRGDDWWLEASLRIAESTFRAGNRSESQRILNVVNALFPGWGNESRRNRADRLMRRISGEGEPAQ